jgi:CHASE3 domain sensor protein
MKVNMRIGTRILAGYGLALVVVGIVGVVAYRGTTELVDSADLVTHSHKVKEAVFEVRSSLKDAETGQRGFLLTGEERYLEPYHEGVKAIDRYLQEARELTVDNPNQQKRLNALQPQITAKLAELAETIALRRQRGE